MNIDANMKTLNLLAFDTSTDAMSIAVQRGQDGLDGSSQVWHHSGPGGAQTSAHLIPAIQDLMRQAGLTFAQLDAIAFGCGPGSFTGLRTACSVAQGLAFGAKVPVLPIDTLLCVAEEARFQHATDLENFAVLALLDARMDELYASHYEFNSGLWRQIGGYSLMRPEDLVCDVNSTLAGNVFAAYGERLPAALKQRVDALPSAAALLRLTPVLLAAGAAVPADQALPIYIRDKVAKTTAERAAEKAAL
jgi:tRNA threonylcarbamoyladenosine biosynthesis protein TsaB